MNNEQKKIVMEAEFHPVIKTYLFIYVIFFLVATVFGILLIPFWLLGLGTFATKKYYDNLKCLLTERTLEFRKGYLFRVEKTIPLDKIQDLTLREGPLLRMFGICILSIETAGQANPQGTSDAKLIGIRKAREFREKVLEQRDLKIEKDEPHHKDDSDSVMEEIRDSLLRIEDIIDAKLRWND